jgi:hypothetical protein
MLSNSVLPVNAPWAPAGSCKPLASRRWLLSLRLFVLCAGLGLLYSPIVEDPAWWPAIGLGSAIASLGTIASLRAFGFAWQSAPIAYAAFLWMFHFPMTLFLHLLPDLRTELSGPLASWMQHSAWYRASLYSLLCVIALVTGACLVSPVTRAWKTQDFGSDTAKLRVGVCTAVGGLGWLYYLMIREGGLDLFGNSYAQMYTSVFGASFSIAIFLVSVGCFIALLSAPRGLIWLPLVLQATGSVPVLLTGSRQFALIGPLVLAVLAAKRGLCVGVVRSGIACLAMLWLISFIGEARSHGVIDGVLGARTVGPVNALVEMGGSLQTTSLAIDWIQNGDGYLLGASYWLPVERGFGLLIPLRTDLATDPRAMNMVVMSRTSGLGGSAVAESYYNFSAFGALFFLLLGYLLARLERNAGSLVSAAFMGVVLYAFIFQARNWFISVPSLILLGSLPVLACYCLEYFARRKELNRRTHLGYTMAGMRFGIPSHWAARRAV